MIGSDASETPMVIAATRGEQAARGLEGAGRAAGLFKLVCEPSRLEVILMLGRGERHVGAIVEALGMSRTAVSQHLTLLRIARIASPRRVGKRLVYGLTGPGCTLAWLVQRLGEALSLVSARG